jgi:hypothetical protein
MAPRDSAVGGEMCKTTCRLPLGRIKTQKILYNVPREDVQIIDEYDKNNVHLTTLDVEIHKHVCRCMLEAALFPGITDWNIKTDTSVFAKELMVPSFPCLPDMKCLRVAHNTPRRCSWLITSGC